MVGFVVTPAGSFQQDQLLSNTEAHPIIPLLTSAAPCIGEDDSRSSKFELWQTQPLLPHHPPTPVFPQHPNPISTPPIGLLYVAGEHSTCQDCGNQAKKHCSHHRCRTCCKNRGFDCSTHIKSTWIPAAHRRDRNLAADATLKKPRLLSSQTTPTSHASNSKSPPRSFDASTSHQDAIFRENLPGHVRAPAVFKCVRVTSIDDGQDQYAYHAKVNIGGHLFKGVLYNQGVDDGSIDLTGASSAIDVNATSVVPNITDLHLGGRKAGGGVRNLPHPDIYGRCGIPGGATFGNALN